MKENKVDSIGPKDLIESMTKGDSVIFTFHCNNPKKLIKRIKNLIEE